MSLSDTFYVALCMTVLVLGVVYWFWTQNQYIQRKLNLLENIVYEMKTSMNSSGIDNVLQAAIASPHHATEDSGIDAVQASAYAPAPLDVDETEAILEEMRSADAEATPAPASSESLGQDDIVTDLQPGGIGSGIVAPTGSALDTMTLKELRRLAEQKNIAGAKNMRKQELIDAIRSSKTTVTPFEVTEGGATLELS